MATMRNYRKQQRGATVVEFALVSVVFFTLLMAIVEFGRWLSTMELVSETTRLGARMAVVCDINDSTIRTRMKSYLPMLGLADSQIAIAYAPASCTTSTCQSVTVSIVGATFTPSIPFLSNAFPLPPFTTSLPRESMESVNAAGEVNPVCN